MNKFYEHPLVAPFVNFFMDEFNLKAIDLPKIAIAQAEDIGNINAKGAYLLSENLIIFVDTLLEKGKDRQILFVFLHEFMHFLQGKHGFLSIKNERTHWNGRDTASLNHKDKPEEQHVDAMLEFLYAQNERPSKGVFKNTFEIMGRLVAKS